MTTALPAVVQRVGGALEYVMLDLESYVDPKRPLNRGNQIALARIVETHPVLNTKERVALLVDAFSFHGVEQRAEFVRIVEAYGLECTYLAMDYLHEAGKSGQGDELDEDDQLRMLRINGVELIGAVADLIDSLRDCKFEVESVEALDYLVRRLGGLGDALDADMDQLGSCLQEPEHEREAEIDDED